MDKVTRRKFFISAGSGIAVGAVVNGVHAQSRLGAAEGELGRSQSDLGPQNTALQRLDQSDFIPPPSDHGGVETFWSSFSNAHRRVQQGGWSRQINVQDFPISTEIAGVNMRLTAGGVRELHWHAADEWGLVLDGSCRLTAVDLAGRPYVQDVGVGDLWYFPTGVPHSIQGLRPDGCEFLLVFNEGTFSEDNTTLLSDWVVHTPRDVLVKNWRATDEQLKRLDGLPPEGRYIFQTAVPGPLAEDRARVSRSRPLTPTAFDFKMLAMPPQKANPAGEVRIVDSTNFPAAVDIAMAHVRLKPGALRELHWHPNADEWQYYLSGSGRMTLFHNKAAARTTDFRAGDVGYVPKTLGHYIENTGDGDLVFLEMFKAPRYEDISLNDWLRHIPPELVRQHLDISAEVLAKIPDANLSTL